MKTPTRLALACALLLTVAALAGCSDDDPAAPASAGPDLSGVWIGTFRDSDAQMTLRQDGDQVTGTVTWGRISYDLAGSVDAAGVFRFGAGTPDPSDCRGMSSTRSHLQVMAQGDRLEGPAAHAESSSSGSDPCGGRTFVQNGLMELERAF